MFNFKYKDIDFAHKLDNASAPNEDYGKHMHYFLEILYFVKGDVKYTVESESVNLTEGDFVLINAGKYHFAEVSDEVPYERYVLKFPDTLLPPFLVEALKERNAFFGNIKKYSIAFNQLDSYYANYEAEEVYYLFINEIVKLLIMLCKEPSYKPMHECGIIAQILAYIEENIYEPITLELISKKFSFSKSYISNEFKKSMKIPVMQYIRHKKIIAAHQMILSGEKKSNVAELFGFEDYSTFYRAYVKIIGKPPADKN